MAMKRRAGKRVGPAGTRIWKSSRQAKKPLPSPRQSVRQVMTLGEPRVRTLKVYALDPSAGNYVGNRMTVQIRWERGLKPGPIGRKVAVVDYDAKNNRYYPPVDLNDPRVLAQGGLDPSESDPRFHQQMVYAVAMETIEKFEAALGRKIGWRRADRPPGYKSAKVPKSLKSGDIWVLNLYPHAMNDANAFYSPEAQGILFGYFTAANENQGRNLPGQRVFTCLSHDIIAHEMTHAIIDGIRTYFTEPTNPDVLAFHEGFADLTALFLHFSHKDALLDTVRKTGGRLYQFELKPNVAPVTTAAGAPSNEENELVGQTGERNPLIELAQQFGEASGMNRGLRLALGKPNTTDISIRVNDVHFRGSILVAAVFDAFFSVYSNRTAALFQVFHAGGRTADDEVPRSLADLLVEQATKTASEFFTLCARSLEYCPPVDITFGDFLRALMTASRDLDPADESGTRDSLMQSFRARGIFPDGASFFSEEALSWPEVPPWTNPPDPDALPPVNAITTHPATGIRQKLALIFGNMGGMTKEEKDINGAVLREYAKQNASRLGFDPNPNLPPELQPYAPSFHTVFRVSPDGKLHIEMIVELVQTRHVALDPNAPKMGTFPMRSGAMLIVSAPVKNARGKYGDPVVRFAIRKSGIGKEGKARERRQREYCAASGLVHGTRKYPQRFQANFCLIHQGL